MLRILRWASQHSPFGADRASRLGRGASVAIAMLMRVSLLEMGIKLISLFLTEEDTKRSLISLSKEKIEINSRNHFKENKFWAIENINVHVYFPINYDSSIVPIGKYAYQSNFSLKSFGTKISSGRSLWENFSDDGDS